MAHKHKNPESHPITAVEGKREFITRFCDAVRDTLITKAEHMPEHWNGHEIREFIADWFDQERTMVSQPIPGHPLDRTGAARRRCYRNERDQISWGR